jgi:hypothetical protein
MTVDHITAVLQRGFFVVFTPLYLFLYCAAGDPDVKYG